MWGRDFEQATGNTKIQNIYTRHHEGGIAKTLAAMSKTSRKIFIWICIPLYNSTRKHEDSREVPL